MNNNILKLIVAAFWLSCSATAWAGNDVILLLDNSQPMRQHDPNTLLRNAAAHWVGLFAQDDRLAMAIFDDKPGTRLSLTPLNGDNRLAMVTRLTHLDYKRKSSNPAAALEWALGELEMNKLPDSVPAIVLVTTASAIEPKNPEAKELETLAQEARFSGVHVNTVVFGKAEDAGLLEKLAKKTAGEFFPIAKDEELAPVFDQIWKGFAEEPSAPTETTATEDSEVKEVPPVQPTESSAEPAPAEETQPEAPRLDSGDTTWILTATALVLFMNIPGLALFYGGLVRTKNVLSVLMQCFSITCLISILWVILGYSLAFTTGGPWLGDLSRSLLFGLAPDTLKGTIPETVFIMFQMTVAIITPALVIGGFAERMKFSAMLWFSLLWSLLVYVPIAHWVWGNGWMQTRGVLDFAGGIVVHINAGVAALVAALVLGRRKGFPQVSMPPHNMTMTVTGAAMLWVGWFGFNAGSALAANGTAGMTMLVTHLGASAGALTWTLVEWRKYGKPSMLGTVTGMVAGLGTITPASGFVGPLGALAIGVTAGFVCFYATGFMKRTLHVDDSLDVFPVHGVGGVIGSVLTGVFAATSLGGMGYAEGVTMSGQVMNQVIGVVVTIVWSGLWTFIILKVIGLFTKLRASVEEETEGLDIVEHNETGYNL
jgi:Amt family ammonium transporter